MITQAILALPNTGRESPLAFKRLANKDCYHSRLSLPEPSTASQDRSIKVLQATDSMGTRRRQQIYVP